MAYPTMNGERLKRLNVRARGFSMIELMIALAILATILSLSMMMRYTFGRDDLAARIDAAVRSVLASGKRTGDIADVNCQLVGTKAMGDAVVSAI